MMDILAGGALVSSIKYKETGDEGKDISGQAYEFHSECFSF